MAETIVTLSGEDAELYKAFQRILDQQAKTDAGYAKIKKSSQDASKEAEKAAKTQAKADKDAADELDKRHKSNTAIVSSIKSMAASYLSVGAALAAINTGQQLFNETQKRALEYSRELAKAQESAAKNIVGVGKNEVAKILTDDTFDIAIKTSFADLPRVEEALGEATSIVGPENAKKAVQQSARLTMFNPDQLLETTTATADLQKALGLEDPREALALASSVMGVSRAPKLAKVTQGVNKVIKEGMTNAPNQDKFEMATEQAAAYAVFGQIDPVGEESANFTLGYSRQLADAFNDPVRTAERKAAFTRLNQQIPDAELKIKEQEIAVKRYERDAGRFKENDESIPAATARNNLAQARENLRQESENLTNYREERNKLSQLLEATKTDPGTFDKRLAQVQQSEALRLDVEKNLTGEKKYFSFAYDLHRRGKAFSEYTENKGRVSLDPTVFEKVVENEITTPEGRRRRREAETDTAINVHKAKNIAAADSAFYAEQTDRVLGATNENALEGAGQWTTRQVNSLTGGWRSEQGRIQDQESAMMVRILEERASVNPDKDEIRVLLTGLKTMAETALENKTMGRVKDEGGDYRQFYTEQKGLLEKIHRELERINDKGDQRAQPQAAVRNQVQQGTNQ